MDRAVVVAGEPMQDISWSFSSVTTELISDSFCEHICAQNALQ